MSKPTLRQLLRYKFDNFMSKGGRSIFISLVVVFLVSLVLFGTIRGIVNYFDPDGAERPGGFINHVYQAFNHLSDPGTMAYDIGSSTAFKITAIFAGMVGIVILSALIAFITTALDQKLGELKKGHSKVIEEDHTLILGWNERVIEILRELLIANESEDDPVVVILSSEDKEFMDDYLKLNMPDTQNMRVVTRSGSVSSLVNLDIVSVTSCKSLIVLANCNVSATDDEKAASDVHVIKTVLALCASRPDDMQLNIVAEIFLERNREIVEDIAPGEVSTVDTNEILAKILVQTSRSVGLSLVYGEILSFDGCELYFTEDDWGDVTFGELGYRFPDGIPLGLKHGDDSLSINPTADTAIKSDDSVLILAEDDSTIDYQPQPVATPKPMTLVGGRKETLAERNLIIGWTPKVEIIIREYADYVLEGSQINIMLRAPNAEVQGHIARLNEELESINIALIDSNPLRTEGLLVAEPFKHDNIIILSQGGEDDSDDRTDSETIVILLLLRNIFRLYPEESRSTKLITEVLDSENQTLVAQTGVHDFIISNRFVSMILAQISEDADIKRVYDDLFEEDGSEIYLKPVDLYFDSFPIEVTYADMIAIAQQREEVCLGVKIKALEGNEEKNYGVKLIPEKNTKYQLQAEDTLVVLAEDET